MFLYAIVLLGLVIFIHELGHFIAARIFNVKVFTFSLGFGKSLFKYKKGETEYRISLIPLGGYVKMLGEGMNDDVPENEIHRSFSGKVWWQKVVIVTAGPVFNILFAMFLYFLVSFYHHTDTAAIVEYVAPESPALAAGLLEGDRVVEIDGKKIYVWDDLQAAMPKPNENGCPEVTLSVVSYGSDSPRIVKITPKRKELSTILGEKQSRCMAGIAPLVRDTHVALVGTGAPLMNGDRVLSVDGKGVDRFYKLIHALSAGASKLTVLRGEEKKELHLKEGQLQNLLNNIRHGGMIVSKVEKGTLSHEIGMAEGDFIHTVNGKSVTSPYDFITLLKGMKEGANVELGMVRDGRNLTKNFDLLKENRENELTGEKDRTVRWGSRFAFVYGNPETAKRSSLMLFSFEYMFSETWNMTELTAKGFYYLASGRLSAKTIGGPIMVFDISKRAAEQGMKVFLAVMAMISINLGLINLLPIPILDGGHMLMYTIEGLTGRAIDRRIKEISMTAGLILLIVLMGFALFNDVNRYFSILLGG